jgi:hypothetical protein
MMISWGLTGGGTDHSKYLARLLAWRCAAGFKMKPVLLLAAVGFFIHALTSGLSNAAAGVSWAATSSLLTSVLKTSYRLNVSDMAVALFG